MDDVLASRFRKTRARRWFQNRKMKTQREHAGCCRRVTRWSGRVTQGCQGMLQESRTEEESRVTLTGLTRFTRIQHRLANTDQVTQDSHGNRDGYSGRRVDRVTWDRRGNWDGGSGQQADRITQVSQGNQDSNQKSGNSSLVNQVGSTE
jgi:hypothetical protein